MPATPSVGHLVTSELNSLLKSVEVVLSFPQLCDPFVITKLDTLHADLISEKEDRQRSEAESRAVAKLPQGVYIA